jgi:SNF2 family DNA or RNA helicase
MIELYRHQKIALSYLRLNDSLALYMEQGTGKTIPVLLRIKELVSQNKAKNVLIVAPKATMGAWHRDLEKLGQPEELSKITIINYDIVWRRKEYKQNWDIIVLDEAHFIKNHSSKRTKALLQLSLNASYRYILTGTASGNGRFEDLWSQFAFLFPVKGARSVESKHFGSYYKFLDRYCVLNKYYQPYRYLHMDEVQGIVHKYSYRVTKDECLDLPEKLPDEIYEIELKDKKLYKSLAVDKANVELDLVPENPMHLMTLLREICSGFYTNNTKLYEVQCEKISVLDDFLETFDKKLAIFANFKYSIRQIEALLKKRKIKYVTLDGETKDKSIWRKFQEDENIQVIVCQYQTASQGIDLFAADTILYYEPTLSSTLLEQSKDRIYRIGQTKPASYIHFITKGTVERSIYNALCKYMDFNVAIFEEEMQEYQKGYNYQ